MTKVFDWLGDLYVATIDRLCWVTIRFAWLPLIIGGICWYSMAKLENKDDAIGCIITGITWLLIVLIFQKKLFKRKKS